MFHHLKNYLQGHHFYDDYELIKLLNTIFRGVTKLSSFQRSGNLIRGVFSALMFMEIRPKTKDEVVLVGLELINALRMSGRSRDDPSVGQCFEHLSLELRMYSLGACSIEEVYRK